MMQEEQKKRVAKAALDYIPENGIIGVGTGTTVNYFFVLLASCLLSLFNFLKIK